MQYIKIIISGQKNPKKGHSRRKKKKNMSSKQYHEEFRINPKPFDAAADKIQFHCAFRSRWKPGFVGQSSGGRYAIYGLVKSGTSHVTHDKRSYITKGVCFSFSRSRTPYQRAESVGPDDLVRKAVMIHHNAFHELLASHFFPVRRGALPLQDPEKVEKILDRIYDELGQSLPDDALLSGCFVQLLQEVSNQQLRNVYPEKLNRALNYITANLDDPELSRERIADSGSVSIRTLSRMFRVQLGISVAQYIIRERLEQVCGMLALPRLSIKEIAQRCGFSSAAFLTGQFRQHFGITPKEYRFKLFHAE